MQSQIVLHRKMTRRHISIFPALMLLPYLLFFVQRATCMAVVPSKSPQTTQNIDDIINSPHIGYVKDPSNKVEVFVIGTSHVKCSSAFEVTQLITTVHPDGVILELDPERVLRLTKQYYGFNAEGNSQSQEVAASQQTTTASNTRRGGKELLYGSDFVAAVTTCQELDIPLFLGDEYAKETQQRLMNQLFRVEAYSPIPLVTSLLPDITSKARADIETTTSQISLVDTFRMDPKKLTPLAVSSSPAFVFAALALLVHNIEAAATIADSSSSSSAILEGLLNVLETSISIVISFFASCFLFNTVIVERDEILADSTTRAWDVLRRLKNGTLIRKRWDFSVDANMNQNGERTSSSFDAKTELPLFTLKTPLIPGKRRNLNLFEPRWLKMIDSITKEDYTSSPSTSSPQFGCVRCANKFYCAASIDGLEGRYADIIFERKGTLASIVELKEGKRPISGDRKIGVAIEGGEEFTIDDASSSISVTNDGYMVAKQWVSNDLSKSNQYYGDNEWVRVVVVVGLLHGNGVLKLLSK